MEEYSKNGGLFPNYWAYMKPPTYITIPPAKELIHSEFGKKRDAYKPIKGSIIGEAIELKDKEWQNGMSYGQFLRYILKVDLDPKPENMSYLTKLLEEINGRKVYTTGEMVY